jgi:hypothetical protein
MILAGSSMLIATFYTAESHTLLFSDKDFIPFVQHLRLKAVILNP